MSHGAFEEFACARKECGQVIVAHADVVRRWRETAESFFCPSGHSNYFPKGKAERERLAEKLALAERRVDGYMRLYESASAEARTCPWPTCRSHIYSSRYGLYSHMERMHGMPRLAEVRAAEDEQEARTA